jgi:hypothetical protein
VTGLDLFIFAYGPAPGVELIPQFLALLAWAGMAVLAVLLAPLTALLRRIRKRKSVPPAGPPPKQGEE